MPTVSGVTADFRLLLVRLLMCYPPLRYHANDWLAMHNEAEVFQMPEVNAFRCCLTLHSMGFFPYRDEDLKISYDQQGRENRPDTSSLMIME